MMRFWISGSSIASALIATLDRCIAIRCLDDAEVLGLLANAVDFPLVLFLRGQAELYAQPIQQPCARCLGGRSWALPRLQRARGSVAKRPIGSRMTLWLPRLLWCLGDCDAAVMPRLHFPPFVLRLFSLMSSCRSQTEHGRCSDNSAFVREPLNWVVDKNGTKIPRAAYVK